MEVATNPNKTNTFPNNLPLHIYKFILLFIRAVFQHVILFREFLLPKLGSFLSKIFQNSLFFNFQGADYLYKEKFISNKSQY